MTDAELKVQLDGLKSLASSYLSAITAIVTGGQESYKLDTGQSVVTVTKINVSTIQTQYESVLNLCDVLESRLNGGAASTGRPLW